MRKLHFSSVLFALLASVSVAALATEAPATAVSPVATTQSVNAEINKIDLNTADAATLEHELKGIGEVKAKAIVAYREANGPFTSVEELLEVKGIGSATLEKNRDKLTVN